MSNLDKMNHECRPSTDDLKMLVECPALDLLKRVSSFTDLDLGAARIVLSQSDLASDATEVFAQHNDLINVITGINEIADFMNEYQDIIANHIPL
jgi:hypothetical protein